MTLAEAYAELKRRSVEIAHLNSCAAVLQWDQQTYMPRAGAAFRGDQLALLATLAHDRATDPRIGELLNTLGDGQQLPEASAITTANLREWRHSYDRATKIPRRLVEELARVTTLAQEAWVQARAQDDFQLFSPHLEQVVALKREEAGAVGFKDHPYDALLDEYEPGMTAREVRSIFADLTQRLVPLVQAIQDSPKKPRLECLEGDFPIDRQRYLGEAAAAAFGFDFQAGRLDTTTHPFCSGFGPGDCRITTRYNPRNFTESLFGILHETGHGLYEQNLAADHFGTAAGMFCSLGIHESQSRLWENQVGRSRPFWDHFFPRVQQAFPGTWTATREDFDFAINAVRPSLIRVEADETTYNLHVALRFEIELGLTSGDLKVADLPGAWNDAMQRNLGLTPPNNRQGCLQDIHWSFGGIGYFPTYTLGNLYAAQFMAEAKQQLGADELDRDFRQGNYSGLKNWLVEKIHRQGRIQRAPELCVQVTRSPLKAEPLLEYLQEKAHNFYQVC